MTETKHNENEMALRDQCIGLYRQSEREADERRSEQLRKQSEMSLATLQRAAMRWFPGREATVSLSEESDRTWGIIKVEELIFRGYPFGDVGPLQVQVGRCPRCDAPLWSEWGNDLCSIGAHLVSGYHQDHYCPAIIEAASSSPSWQQRLAEAVTEAVLEAGNDRP